jgi:nucleoside-diphosphate-sugar epimerase
VKYFVTGATGFVGGAVARQLATAGHHVVAIARDPTRAKDLISPGLEVVRGDVTDRESLKRPMTAVDGVFHIAGWYKVGSRDEAAAVATNVHGTRNVLEVMRELGIAKGVYTSTLAVNSDTHGQIVDESYKFAGTHLTIYDRTKAEAHQIALDFIGRGLPLAIVQPGLVYGPGDTSTVRTTLVQYLRQQLRLLPKQTAFCWAHVDDIASGHVLAMTKGAGGRAYFLAGPPSTLIDAIDLAQDICGIPAPKLRVSPAFLRSLAAMTKVVETIVKVPDDYSSEALKTIAGTTYLGTNERARRELGWTPRPLRPGLAETLRHEMTLLGMQPRF